jgi:uncharacterized protein with FMN-binding domain
MLITHRYEKLTKVHKEIISQKDIEIDVATQALGESNKMIYSMNQRLEQMEGQMKEKIQEYFY